MKRICVYCGANPGNRPDYAVMAQRVGATLAERGLGLVYGGGSVGLMGIVADSVLAAGGEVIGVIPKVLTRKELIHSGVTEMHRVGSMHERKALMEELSDGFIALPGGLGTLDELFEILTWGQLGLHQKPIGLLNGRGYYDPLLVFLRQVAAEGFVQTAQIDALFVAEQADTLLDRFGDYQPMPKRRWIERENV